MDKTGILFMGIQVLSEENKMLKSEVRKQRSENEKLKNEIAEIKATLAALPTFERILNNLFSL